MMIPDAVKNQRKYQKHSWNHLMRLAKCVQCAIMRPTKQQAESEVYHMAVTSQQIAELAGVSRGTVDRALHNRGRVNPEVAARIFKIAEELGYKPNVIGQALVRTKRDF